VATSRKISKPESCVSCATCYCEIPLQGTLRMPRQISILCPNCGQRNIYQSAEIHDSKQGAETTHIFQRNQFGKKRTFIQPKSRLNEWASWLLQ
jgi:predicted RNA-binding Zn-ribbon protein involved in translation (DUF1610 family)